MPAAKQPTDLRRLRERAGLSRVDLVKQCPVSVDPGTIYKLEKGKQETTSVKIAFALAETLSKALGEPVTVYDLFPPQQGRFLNAHPSRFFVDRIARGNVIDLGARRRRGLRQLRSAAA